MPDAWMHLGVPCTACTSDLVGFVFGRYADPRKEDGKAMGRGAQ